MENDTNKYYLNGKKSTKEKINESGKFILNIEGENNKVYLNDFDGPGKLYIEMKCDKSELKFGSNNSINNYMQIFFPIATNKKSKNVSIKIGKNNMFNGNNIIFIAPIYDKNSLTFGSYNLVASNVIFRGRNDHVMYDLKTKKVLNNEERLVIGDNNWICDNVQLMPKANIKNGNVIALGSIVNKKLKCSNSLIAGIPAVVKKEGIGWNISANLDDIKRGH